MSILKGIASIKTRVFLLTCLVLAVLFAAGPKPVQALPAWPGVSFVFDDGHASIELARPLFQDRGMVGTVFPVVSVIGVDPSVVTWEDLEGLVADGWEIGSHSMTHPDLTTVTDTQLDYELSMSKQTLETNLSTTVYAFALPYGTGHSDERVLGAASKYYHFVRNANREFNSLPPSPYRVRTYEVSNTTTVDTVKGWIDDAKAQGKWLVITFHRINAGDADPNDEYSYGTNQLGEILDYVHTNDFPAPTFSGVFGQFAPVAHAGVNQTVQPDAKVDLDGSGSYDPCAQTPLSYAWSFTSKPAGSSATLSDANTINPSFTLDAEGNYEVQLVVTNTQGVASQPATVTIGTTAPSNNPPVANAGLAQTLSLDDVAVLDGSSSSDPDGNPLTYAWSFISKPTDSAATLSDSAIVNPSFTVDKAGDYELQLIVTDSLLAASAPSTVIISTINSAPIANAGSPQTVVKGATVNLNGSGSYDIEGTSLAYTWSFTSRPSGSTASLSNSASMNPTFLSDKIGNFGLQLIVTDTAGAVSTPASVTINTRNSPPVANAGAAQTVHIGAAVTLDGSASYDPDEDPITYAWSLTSKPADSSAILNNHTTVNPSFTADQEGNYVLQLIVTDSRGADSDPATVTISAPNSPPVANAGPAQTVSLGGTVTLDGSGSSDPDGDALTYAWSISSKPADSAAALTDPTGVHPTFTVDKNGVYVVQLIVTDSRGAASDPATVTISTPNSPPVANAGSAQSVSLGAAVTLDGSGSSDPDGDGITYAWSFTAIPEGSTATLSDVTSVNPTFTADIAGSYALDLIVTDSRGAASAPASVTITAQNSAPVANAGPAQNVPLGTIVTLDGSGSADPDGDSITYAWSFTSKPADSSASLSDATSVNPTFTADKAGSYVLQLIVTDSHSEASAPATVTISTQNSQPVADAGLAQTVPRGTTITLDGSASADPDGDTLTYAWSFTSKPADSSASLSDATSVNPTFMPDVDGDYVLQLTVTDSHGVASIPAEVTISAQNSAPVANAGSFQSVFMGATLTLNGSASSDPNGDPLTYAWSFTSKPAGSSASLSDAASDKPTFKADKAGIYTIKLIVTDSQGVASTPSTVTISARNPLNSRAVAVIVNFLLRD